MCPYFLPALLLLLRAIFSGKMKFFGCKVPCESVEVESSDLSFSGWVASGKESSAQSGSSDASAVTVELGDEASSLLVRLREATVYKLAGILVVLMLRPWLPNVALWCFAQLIKTPFVLASMPRTTKRKRKNCEALDDHAHSALLFCEETVL